MHYVYPVLEVLYTIDGDTVKLVRPLLETTGRLIVSLRLFGLNAPEAKKTKLGGEAEKAAGKLVGRVVEEWIKARAGQQFYATSDVKPKYHGRIIGRLIAGWPRHDDSDDELNAYLLRERLVKVSKDGRREPWTDAELAGITERARALLGEA